MDYSNKPSYFFTTALLLILYQLLTVNSEERFLEEPEDATLSQGQSHTLRCTIADRSGTAQWLRDGFGLGPGPIFDGFPRYQVLENHARGEYYLEISEVQLEDDAVFECQVGATQSSNGLKSRRAKLSVLLPTDEVRIEKGNPRDVVAGEINHFTCTALNGKPAPAVTWYSSSGPDFLTERQHNVTKTVTVQNGGKREDIVSTLSFIPQREDQGVEIVCSAKNGAMSTPKISSVILNVQFKPEVTMEASEDVVINEGSSLVLTCSAKGNPKVLGWRWLKDGVEVPGEMKESLRVPRVSGALDGATIECEASNSVGSTTKSRKITVHYGPQFKEEPRFPAANLGDDVTLTCDVISNPPAVIRWTRPGSSRVIGSGSSLLIQNVREADFWSGFTCSALGGSGAEVHRHMRIIKRGPPRIVSNNEQGASYGSLGKVECIVEGVPKPNKIYWSKNGQEIDISNSKRFRVSEEDLTYGVKSVLEIASVQPSDFNPYNCTAISELGSDSMVINFSKTEVIHIAYIISGVVVGLLIIVAIIVVVIVCHRRKKLQSHSGGSSTTSSDDSIKKIGQPNLKIEFSSDTVDSWQQKSLLDSTYPQHSTSEYYEVRYPGYRDGGSTLNHPIHNGYASSVDGYGTYGHGSSHDPYYRPPSRQTFENPYGTLPRGPGSVSGRINAYPVARSDVGHYGTATGSDIYATYGTRRPRYNYTQPGPAYQTQPQFDRLPPQPLSPTESKLSTNV